MQGPSSEHWGRTLLPRSPIESREGQPLPRSRSVARRTRNGSPLALVVDHRGGPVRAHLRRSSRAKRYEEQENHPKELRPFAQGAWSEFDRCAGEWTPSSSKPSE